MVGLASVLLLPIRCKTIIFVHAYARLPAGMYGPFAISESVCIFLCLVNIYAHIYIYTHICRHTYIHTYIHTYMHTYIYLYTSVHILTCLLEYARILCDCESMARGHTHIKF